MPVCDERKAALIGEKRALNECQGAEDRILVYCLHHELPMTEAGEQDVGRSPYRHGGG